MLWLQPLFGEQTQRLTSNTESQSQNGVLLQQDIDETLKMK